MATVYKSTTYNAVNTRATSELSNSEKTAMNNTLTSFFTYFKAKHL